MLGAPGSVGAQSLQDPTRPPAGERAGGAPAAVPAPAGDWVLSYTLVSGERAVAIINGERVRPGHRVAGARVERILPGEVQLRHDGRLITLRLTPSVKTSPNNK
ncbi:MSHA biogenesis protein MshK [Ectothiorhodospiraceae bacterium 2226]|nr:MSHA biogenesis protein MshK [Ectothiorhodospiraceae bacterium 2226]